ncbi:MAG: PAS domain S-box protein, partial [Gammaproteobacteria bacterium]
MNADHSAPAATWNEAERLTALARYRVFDGTPNTELDELAALAAELFACPAAAIHLIDQHQQHCIAAFSIEQQPQERACSVPAQAIEQADPLFVRRADELRAPVRMPRLVDGQHADFCAAAVLRDADGLPLGTLSIYDRQPRELSARQRAQLEALARQAMALLELRRLCNEQARSRQIIDSAQNYAIIATDLRGLVTSWNSGAQQLLGWSEDEVCGRHVELMFTEQDRAADVPEQEMRTALEQGRALD